MMDYSEFLPDEDATVAAGRRLGQALEQGLAGGPVVFLEGVLGAGKTTLCRGIMSAFGHNGAVKSPTYTLVEPYDLPSAKVYHFDLYRLGHAEELEFMGIRDYFQPDTLCVIEWPSRGAGVLPEPDWVTTLGVEGVGRRLTITAHTETGQRCLVAVSGG
jgi:tRNA threonylcarbamoyladenosine biosynthesis protein TsaE